MNLRDLKIGTRLGLGFGVILVSASALIAGALVSNGSSRGDLLSTLQKSRDREALAVAMRQSLLHGAVAVRSMGLQTAVDGVQKDEAEAKKHIAEYRTARGKLEADGLGDKEREVFTQLAGIDRQLDAHFKEAVDLAAQFNTEQAAATILQKIDPLQQQATLQLNRFIELQAARTAEATDDANRQNATVVGVIAVAGLVLLALAGLTAWRITASITGPLGEAVAASRRVAQGDLASDIAVAGHDEAAQLLTALREMRDSLARMVAEVRQGAVAIDGASDEIAQGNADLSSRTELQAGALQQTASSVEHLTGMVQHNASSAQRALALVQAAAGQADTGHAVVAEVIHTMGAINAHSRKIGEITSVINSIAFQTNILALNAAVEAARAGEQGRGFAVVASEVRTLSQRTTQAAKEIEGLIREAAARTASGSDLVNQAGGTIGEVRQSVREVAELINEISAASQEQTDGMQSVNRAITDIDRTTQQNAALVEQAAAASDSMREQTRRLTSMVSVFNV
ncbi:MAG: methyl-accepting chemotaxis protein [Aquabacterium sp.]|nr:methyl-accepting chemotaxis protein [Aquabacterium sp.]